MINWFKAEPGWTWSNQPLYTWSYDWSQSNKDTAYDIQARVNSILSTHCASKIDFITHSMGGLSSRWYIKWLAGGNEKVDDWVSLAGPNHGTTKVPWSGPGLACTWIQFWSGAYPSCRELATGSSFLFSLNEGDETPWAVNYATWRTECDQWVDPRTSTSVVGAANGVVTWACPDHSGIYKDRGVYERVRDFVY